jgi:hypothetical protein
LANVDHTCRLRDDTNDGVQLVDSHLLAKFAATGLASILTCDALALGPSPIKLGPVQLIPTIGLAEGYDSNPQEAPSGQRLPSAVTRITPSLVLRARRQANYYDVSYLGHYDFYGNKAIPNRFDHLFLAHAHEEFSARHRLDLTAGFDYLQMAQNATNRANHEQGNISNTFTVGGNYGFGAATTRAGVNLAVNYTGVRYLNNLNSGSFTRAQEYDSPSVQGVLLYGVGARTRLLAQVGYTNFSYIWSGSNLNSYNLTGLVGATWKATAKTSGTLKVGYMEKQFQVHSIPSARSPTWELSATWTPTARAALTLSSIGGISEGSAFAQNILTQTYRLQWNHQWRRRFATQVFASYLDQKYQGGIYGGRLDKTTTVGLRATYNLRRWVDVDLEYNYKQDNSNYPQASFDRNWFFLQVTFSL